jgi:uncharacterized protein YlxW (UPF0749 family)
VATSEETPAPAQAALQAGAPAEAAPPPATGRRAKRRLARAMMPKATRGQLIAGLMCAVLGFALVAQVRQTQQEGISSLRQGDLVRILTGLTEQSARLDVEARRLEAVREELTTGSDTSAAAEEAAQQRLEVLGVLTGTSPAEGPGIELAIEDPDNAVTAAILLDTLQELRDAGAEAVQLADVRIVASSAFVDASDGVRVDGRRLTPPYRYRAIGDPQTLSAALDIPGGVLEVLRQEGASGSVTLPDVVTVDAVTTPPEPQYARPAPQ